MKFNQLHSEFSLSRLFQFTLIFWPTSTPTSVIFTNLNPRRIISPFQLNDRRQLFITAKCIGAICLYIELSIVAIRKVGNQHCFGSSTILEGLFKFSYSLFLPVQRLQYDVHVSYLFDCLLGAIVSNKDIHTSKYPRSGMHQHH